MALEGPKMWPTTNNLFLRWFGGLLNNGRICLHLSSVTTPATSASTSTKLTKTYQNHNHLKSILTFPKIKELNQLSSHPTKPKIPKSPISAILRLYVDELLQPGHGSLSPPRLQQPIQTLRGEVVHQATTQKVAQPRLDPGTGALHREESFRLGWRRLLGYWLGLCYNMLY